MIKEFPFVKYHDGGIIEIFGNESGTPEVTAVVPAPDINTPNGVERQKRYDEATNGITLQGYLIIEKKMIRNKSFDDPGQQTTLQIRYRPCKNRSEIEQVHMQITKILGMNGDWAAIEVGGVPK